MIFASLQDFCKFFELGKSIIAIDYGQKKIGIALSSPDHLIPMPLKMIMVIGIKEQLVSIMNLLEEKKPCAIVLGFPVNMDGSKSEQSLIVENFANKLAGRTNLPIFLQDERLTSRAADNFIKDLGFNRKKRNQKDDLAAASMILETTLLSVSKYNKERNLGG